MLFRFILFLDLFFLSLTLNLGSRPQQAQASEIWLLRIEGVIGPVTARYFKNEVQAAQGQTGPEAIVLELNTPGGLESSMREMTQIILNSSIPIVVYVTPRGARAASAGMFITLAAHVAVMAPGTNIGAAHPVSLGAPESKEGKDSDSVMTSKVTNDAAALARAIAKDQGRNSQWADSAVRESVSITGSEAVKKNVIDFVAQDLPDLFRKLDQRKVKLATGSRILNTNNPVIVKKPMNFAEQIIQTVTDPNIAYLLMTIGFIGIIAELYNPGMMFPGITGVVSLLLAFAAFGSLPINWAGIILLVLGVALFIVELHTAGTGFLGVAAVISFILGSLILYRPFEPMSPSLPQVHLNPGLLAGVSLILFAFLAVVIRAAFRVRRLPVTSGSQGLVGLVGVALSDLSPTGTVRIDSEEWSASLAPGVEPLHAGDLIEVVEVEGVTLKVRRAHLGQSLQVS